MSLWLFPVRLIARFEPNTDQVSLARVYHLVFGRSLILFLVYPFLTLFLSMCSSSLLDRCPYQPNRRSVLFLGSLRHSRCSSGVFVADLVFSCRIAFASRLNFILFFIFIYFYCLHCKHP